MKGKFNIKGAIRKQVTAPSKSHETETFQEIKNDSVKSSILNEKISQLNIEITKKNSQAIENKSENITFISEEINREIECNYNMEWNIEHVDPYVLRPDNKCEEMSELNSTLNDNKSDASTRSENEESESLLSLNHRTGNCSKPLGRIMDASKSTGERYYSNGGSTKSQQKNSEKVHESQEERGDESVTSMKTAHVLQSQKEQIIDERPFETPVITKAYKPKFNFKGAFIKDKSKSNQNKPTESPDVAVKNNDSTIDSMESQQNESENMSISQVEQMEGSIITSDIEGSQQKQTIEERPVKSSSKMKVFKPKFNAKGAISKEKSRLNQNKPRESPDEAIKDNDSTLESVQAQQNNSVNISMSQEEQMEGTINELQIEEPQQKQTIEERSIKASSNTKAFKLKFNAKGALSKEKSRLNQNKPRERSDKAITNNNSILESMESQQNESENISIPQAERMEGSINTSDIEVPQQKQTIEERSVKSSSNTKVFKPKFNAKGAMSKEKSRLNQNKPRESPDEAIKNNDSTLESIQAQQNELENISMQQEERMEESVNTSGVEEPQQKQTIEERPVKASSNTKAFKPKFNAKGALSKEKSRLNQNKPTESPGADKTRLESPIKTRVSAGNSGSEQPNNIEMEMECDVNEEPVANTIRNATEIDNSAMAVDSFDALANKFQLGRPLLQIDANSSESQSLRSNSPEPSLDDNFMATNGNNQLTQCSDSVSGCVRSKTSRKQNRAPVLLHSQPQETNAPPIDINKIKMKDILNADIRYPPQKYRLERKNNKTKRNKQSSTEIVDTDTSSDSNNLNIPFPREQRFRLDLNGQIVLDDEEDIENQQIERENMEEILERAGELRSTYRSYTKRKLSGKRWQQEETDNFYLALMHVGTNFTAMASVFTGRSRADLKKKFKVEEKKNQKKIEIILKNVQPWNLAALKFDSHIKKPIEKPRCDAVKKHMRELREDNEEPVRKRRRYDKNLYKVDETASNVPDYLKALCK